MFSTNSRKDNLPGTNTIISANSKADDYRGFAVTSRDDVIDGCPPYWSSTPGKPGWKSPEGSFKIQNKILMSLLGFRSKEYLSKIKNPGIDWPAVKQWGNWERAFHYAPLVSPYLHGHRSGSHGLY
jgi:hypothetical protein